MTAEDYAELAKLVDQSTGFMRDGERTVAVVFDAGRLAKLLRERAEGAISVPGILVPKGMVPT